MSVCFSGSLLAHTCINCNYFWFVMLCWKIKYDDDDDDATSKCRSAQGYAFWSPDNDAPYLGGYIVKLAQKGA